MASLTAAYRRQLAGLSAAALRDILALWPLFDPNDMRTWPSFLRPATLAVQEHHARAVALGARYYSLMRAEVPHVPHNEVTLPPIVMDDTQVASALAATALAGTFGALKRGQPMAAALDNGFVRAGMSAGRLVMNGGRDAVLAATRGDAHSRGYVRVTGGGCTWCESLAGERTTADTFQAHDGCGCTAEPTWT